MPNEPMTAGAAPAGAAIREVVTPGPCEVCWSTAWTPVPTTEECALAHPHSGDHVRCECCWLHEGLVTALAEVQRLRAELAETEEQRGLLEDLAEERQRMWGEDNEQNQKRIKALEHIGRRLLAWNRSSAVQAAFSLAYIHGQGVSAEFSKDADKVWQDLAEALRC